MHYFPKPEAIDDELSAAGQLPVLYCHSCCKETHDFHARLAIVFERHGLLLECDPFKVGDDVQVAMRTLHIHGVVFHADANSTKSRACAAELRTAQEINAPVFTLCDGVATPIDQRDRLSITLPARTSITPAAAESLAVQMRERARVHWVIQWLIASGRTFDEREAGAIWLGQQSAQVLAEFFGAIVRLHLGASEDPTVSAQLAAVLEVSNYRSEAKIHLLRWHSQVKHPLSRLTIEDILRNWGWEIPGATTDPIPPTPTVNLKGLFAIIAIVVMMGGIVTVATVFRGIHIRTQEIQVDIGSDMMKAAELIDASTKKHVRQEDW